MIGWVSERFGPRVGLGAGGFICLVAALAAIVVIKRGAIERRLRLAIPGRRQPVTFPEGPPIRMVEPAADAFDEDERKAG